MPRGANTKVPTPEPQTEIPGGEKCCQILLLIIDVENLTFYCQFPPKKPEQMCSLSLTICSKNSVLIITGGESSFLLKIISHSTDAR